MEYLSNLINSGAYYKLEGWCSPEKALKLAEIIIDNKCKVCVELGVFAGRSLLPIAIASGKDSKVVGIDAWSSNASSEGVNDKVNEEWWNKIDYDKFFKYTKDLMNIHKVKVELIRDKSVNVVNMFEDQSIDLLHQDSNHSEEVSSKEVELYWNKVKRGGFWVFDDTNWETTQKAQNDLKSKGYEVIYETDSWTIFKRL